MKDAQQLWEECSEAIRSQVSEATWRTWFASIAPVAVVNGTLVLAVPNVLVRERLESRFSGMLRDAVSDAAGTDLPARLEVLVDVERVERYGDSGERLDGNGSVPGAAAGSDPSASAGSFGGLGTSGLALSNQHLSNGSFAAAGSFTSQDGVPIEPATRTNSRYTFEGFVIGPSNRFAHAAALSVAEAPARAYNPLFIIGAAGLGKTHLLQAIRNYVTENFSRYQVAYVSTETFMNEFVEAIRNNTTSAFKRRYRQTDVLLIDDIQFMEGKESLQEEFFHTFNSLYEASKQLVLTSDRPPGSITTLESRLRSRFLSGLIAEVQPPELETRIAILRTKAEHERAVVGDEVLEFIASNVKDNIRELEGALIRVTAYASLNRQPLTRELAETVLSDLVAGRQPRRITAQQILRATAEYFDFSVVELCGPSRRRPLVMARQIGMYVFRELTDFSYPAIAREFGGRDHTTVIHAVEKIARLMKERRQVYEQVTELLMRVRNGE
ncbi:MAG TPA: chromosomal replication initiator protein DnaA [Acidimicrobiales bacterium]|nr:chromosomal replication initiator protein DnaA [Acidimicrobiales bacterium]